MADQLTDIKNTIPNNKERVDISNINIDMSAPALVRAMQYLSQIKNPYAFRYGNVKVNLLFCPEGKSLKQSIHDYFLGQNKKGAVTKVNSNGTLHKKITLEKTKTHSKNLYKGLFE